jgi:hypothetical protein
MTPALRGNNSLVMLKVAFSQCVNNMLIFVIQDDAQDSGDHVDAHRGIAFIVAPYVTQNAALRTTP